MTGSKPAASRFTSGTIASPSLTASAPPGMKSFCTSTTRSTSRGPGLILVPLGDACWAPWACARVIPVAAVAASAPAIVLLRNPRRSVTMTFSSLGPRVDGSPESIVPRERWRPGARLGLHPLDHHRGALAHDLRPAAPHLVGVVAHGHHPVSRRRAR